MHLQTILIAALSAFVCAQSGPNPIVPLPPSIQAGVANTVSWAPNTPGTVSLQLRWGSAGNLVQGIPIANNIPNTGAFTWTPDPNLKAGSDHTVEIINDADKSQTNFSPAFGLVSEGKGIDSPTPKPPAATTTTTTEEASSKETMTSTESPTTTETATKTTSASPKATTNAAARVGGGIAALAGVGAVVVGAL